MPLYITFIDLPRRLLLSAKTVFSRVFQRSTVHQNLQSIIESFHTNMKGTVQFNGSSSRQFDIRSDIKQGCVLAPTLFEICFALLLRHIFGTASEGICLLAISDGRFFNLGRLRANTKFVKPSSETCCSLTMQQRRPTPIRTCRH